MPAKTKLSTAQRAIQIKKENDTHLAQAKRLLASDNVVVSSDNKTKIANNFYMVKADNTYWMREDIRRSAKVKVMKWRKIG